MATKPAVDRTRARERRSRAHPKAIRREAMAPPADAPATKGNRKRYPEAGARTSSRTRTLVHPRARGPHRRPRCSWPAWRVHPTAPDGWWLTVLWVADDDGVVSFRDVAPTGGPPPDPPLARLGPALSGRPVRADPRGCRPTPAPSWGDRSCRRRHSSVARATRGPRRLPVRAGARRDDARHGAGRDGPRRVPPRRRGSPPTLSGPFGRAR